MYLKEFEIRWSDVDANRHLANSAYLNYMSHARMSFLMEIGVHNNEEELTSLLAKTGAVEINIVDKH